MQYDQVAAVPSAPDPSAVGTDSSHSGKPIPPLWNGDVISTLTTCSWGRSNARSPSCGTQVPRAPTYVQATSVKEI